jgi:hypothetical protein
MVSPPTDAVTLAVALVHEFQHIKLGGLLHLGSLCRTDNQEWYYYAPWRDDPRHLSGLLQGIYAFVGITAFWRERRGAVRGLERRVADFEYAYARQQVDHALRTITATGDLTTWGRQVVKGLSDRVQPWLTESLPFESIRLAALVASSHRAGWRIRSTRPAPADVRALEHAWMGDEPLPAGLHEAVVEPQPTRQWSLGMLALARRHITAPEAGLAESLRVSGLTSADLALVRGDKAAARAGYLARVTADADDLHAWIGLGLADEACSALVDRPELVRAVYLRLVERDRAPDLATFTSWIGRAMVRSDDASGI